MIAPLLFRAGAFNGGQPLIMTEPSNAFVLPLAKMTKFPAGNWVLWVFKLQGLIGSMGKIGLKIGILQRRSEKWISTARGAAGHLLAFKLETRTLVVDVPA